MTDPIPSFTELDAARVYARAMNRLDLRLLEGVMAEDVVYESQMVFSALVGRQRVVDYLLAKFVALAKSPETEAFAEMGTCLNRPCVVLAQGSKCNLVCLAFLTVADDRIARIDIAIVPHPSEASRSGEYPE